MVSSGRTSMDTLTLRKKDLEILLGVFDEFIEVDHQSCDCCKFCDHKYGNATLLKERGERLLHKQDCPVLVAQDVGTGL